MASSVILLKPHLIRINVIQIFQQKNINYDPVTFSVDCNANSGLIFEEIMSNYAASAACKPYIFVDELDLGSLLAFYQTR